jgi:hypothetical protein
MRVHIPCTPTISVLIMLVLLGGLPALADHHDKRDQCPCPPPPPPPAKPINIIADGASSQNPGPASAPKEPHIKRDSCPCPPPPPPPAKPGANIHARPATVPKEPHIKRDASKYGSDARRVSPSCPPNSPNKEHRLKRDSPSCPPNSPVKEHRLKRDVGPGSRVPKPPPPEGIVLAGLASI